jgi:hypothetical protein
MMSDVPAETPTISEIEFAAFVARGSRRSRFLSGKGLSYDTELVAPMPEWFGLPDLSLDPESADPLERMTGDVLDSLGQMPSRHPGVLYRIESRDGLRQLVRLAVAERDPMRRRVLTLGALGVHRMAVNVIRSKLPCFQTLGGPSPLAALRDDLRPLLGIRQAEVQKLVRGALADILTDRDIVMGIDNAFAETTAVVDPSKLQDVALLNAVAADTSKIVEGGVLYLIGPFRRSKAKSFWVAAARSPTGLKARYLRQNVGEIVHFIALAQKNRSLKTATLKEIGEALQTPNIEKDASDARMALADVCPPFLSSDRSGTPRLAWGDKRVERVPVDARSY